MTYDSSRVWFITGASTGFGRAIARAALAAGNRVVATARDTTALADLASDPKVLALHLDVTDQATIDDAVRDALGAFGRIDVLVNNAGYGLRGAIEELDDADLRKQFDTNVFGVLAVTRAVLPTMRQQGSGLILQMSSVGGVTVALGGAAYAGTKFALEGLSEALAAEVAYFGIKVVLVEPGPFRTDFAGRSIRWAEPLAAYEPVLDAERTRFDAQDGQQPGDPDRAAEVILTIADMAEPPLRVPLGPQSFDRIRAALTARLAALDEIEPLARDTSYR
ncbi:oxidoreductase [Antrihabitans cavernicola]|uniref:SDR family NAD(P)-dependent oxidoreductase n=1 Tax=Antrihabitans cavernicola TaxID=2495913 RepID=A0A5A7SCH2_9NOCA|nr:oxidoreductase [Spelaeibacter cavernicola]KAA0022293.1 SDR family NAD(P)-dependent oxidoreductase [Spelaeibacter cavernicola]